MPEAYIVDAARTAVGRRGGGFADSHPADMAAHVIKTVTGRHDFDPADIDDVILGCLDNIGSQAGDIARTSALAAGLPESVPGVTIDRQCGSAQQAVSFAAQAVMSGTSDIIVAGGVQKMSQYPILSAFGAGEPFGSADPWTGCKGWFERYGDQEISQFRGAEMIADQWGLSREDNERFALESHRRALHAIDNGYFEKEITEFEGITTDEGPRRDTSAERLAGLKTLIPDGVLTAGVASQISDGAAALLVVSEAAVERYGFTPRARVHHISARGADPVMMLSAPIPATQHALKRAGLSIEDIDTVEINEAFAPVALAWIAEIGADPAKVNPNGGAIALGHPIGCTGARLMTSMLHELERTGGRYGLQTMCEGGGQANVTIIERL
ncbi:acetyl-CoA C-acetyltransferase [Gordonia sp. (in: high G+C Gram-positive bacteria)]|jgi:acetyl-CoA C-acetyltransferase|uniref:acetyl-CoA C-acetyltransferase n=1 Tax=Gordonia sp. (in: high G+C Gram-positive bacteria) TaxID=84139 RepID=UPI001D4BA6B3|nr:acetyl-CoA C-acetyltransferase [Gordonia sp. (in: high G+C Gram-positive bacteria)]MCB1296637.1 acetyl-CoA C-acetyltransferase [Gordonia sp. (in: high G+C Gram-positive bacteria)]HMS75795.1 acetyl-CoA C-acetyltransferase [Gordonia sp. (in: high G+C Gram-positive bacteria)]HQV18615.1 acetyl-CoA C-acetyltransferase [Gordonia sp. (in: high G+C Gram-positive bacteria)]